MFKVLVSRTFKKQLEDIPNKYHAKIKKGLRELEADPYSPRPKADIKPLAETSPQKYRIRIGEYRIIYCVEEDAVKVIEIFARGRGYRGD